MTELQEYISTYFGVSNEDMDTIMRFFEESELKKGDYFAQKDQYCKKMSFVKEGFIRVFAGADDKEITQWISSKGYFITDINSFVFKQRSRWNIQALTDCKLYTIGLENYHRLKDVVPDWGEIEKRFMVGCFMLLEDRVFNHLSLSAEERYQQLFDHNKDLFNQVPLKYIASMLGMSPETLSRIRSK